jgi:hypothetical protein
MREERGIELGIFTQDEWDRLVAITGRDEQTVIEVVQELESLGLLHERTHKVCELCTRVYPRDRRFSKRAWMGQRFCSQRCRWLWHRGDTWKMLVRSFFEAGVPYGFCQCGCGQRTGLAKGTAWRSVAVAGEPLRYRRGHQRRAPVASLPDEQLESRHGWKAAVERAARGV